MAERSVNKGGYRKLTSEERGQLVMQGCSSDNWDQIQVVKNFSTVNIHDSRFTGQIKLGIFTEEVRLFGGVKLTSGIYNSWLNNVTVGDNVLIHNVHSYISNYTIESRAVIHNVNIIAVDGESTFGNGVRVKAINEQGGREIPIYDHLSTHIAYILALYRHRRDLISVIESLVAEYVEYIRSDMGVIKSGATILNCDSIKNVRIGSAARIEGVRKLVNGSINSCYDDPVFIGDGVIMENFIVSSGSRITDGTLISNCFIGQGCLLDKQYSAVESLFFANCQGFHGEACSVFAGPYTVTHHKSTLLIAGIFSFLNAGSGSNQSNHLYKLGPLHQGVIERGVKTTSDSYLLWPSHIGAFSLVMGRHYKNNDTSDFPFSYLIESNDESILVPAINLKSVGTIRDSKKWPVRDVRRDPNLLDHINFNLLSPYTAQKMINGKRILENLKAGGVANNSGYRYNRMLIRADSLDRAIYLYDLAIVKFLGNSLITRLQGRGYDSDEELQKALEKDTPVGAGRWVDLSGLITPLEALEVLFKSVEGGSITSIEEINAMLTNIHRNYYSYEWTWSFEMLREYSGLDMSVICSEELIEFIEKWRSAVLEIDRYLYEDARKEFSLLKMTGFGVDGTEWERHLDFESVRGEFETNPMVKSIEDHIKAKDALGEEMLSMLRGVKSKVTEE
ncbi:MAG: DUF4954 family protein [Bacteroidales bacterium]|nr:DUF4954 family protein [Bacteroidales bacterium]